jgi:hypothetical protein
MSSLFGVIFSLKKIKKSFTLTLREDIKLSESTFILSMQNTISTQFFKHPFLFQAPCQF